MGCGCGGSNWQPPALVPQGQPVQQDAVPWGQYWTGPQRPATSAETPPLAQQPKQ